MDNKCFSLAKKWLAGLLTAGCFALPFTAYACGESVITGLYRIGYDPQWASVDFNGLETAISGFSIDLLNEIVRLERRSVSMRKFDGNDLQAMQDLHRIEAYISPLSNSKSLGRFYLVSDPYLSFGSDLHLHLIACPDDGHDVINTFNHGLKALKKMGRYTALVQKWNLQDFTD
ncbi:MAG: hypothetical protein V4492_03780 [Chlamydiota bacterium]